MVRPGLVNWLLITEGLVDAPINFTGDARTAMGMIILADVWKTTPFMALLILAALQTIPSELTESAQLDGAGPVRQFFSITLPLIMPAMLIAALLRALDAFRIFDLPYVLTGGGPAGSTEVMSTLAYKTLFSGSQYGYGGASGYLAGRSVWRDAVSTPDPERRVQAVTASVARIDRLNETTRKHGRAFRPGVTLAQALDAQPEDWFTRWHTQ